MKRLAVGVVVVVLLALGAGMFANLGTTMAGPVAHHPATSKPKLRPRPTAMAATPRTIGKSNYTLKKLLIHALNMITGFSTVPLRLASLIGFAVMLLGFVLGPLMEENLRRAMLIARGDVTVFFTRPISAALLSTAILLLVIAAMPKIRRRRDEVFVE